MGLKWFDYVLVCSSARIAALEVDIAVRLYDNKQILCCSNKMDSEINNK
eukprot:UN21978